MSAQRIEREVLIAAPPPTVWMIVTEPEHIARWFSDAAEVDLRPGGEAVFTWVDHGPARARVEDVDAPNRFSFVWVRTGEEPLAGNATRVEITLQAQGDGTLLRVVETGFADLDWASERRAHYLAENERGWGVELDELRTYASSLR